MKPLVLLCAAGLSLAAALPAHAFTTTGSSLPAPGDSIAVGDIVLADVTFDFGAVFNLVSSDIRIEYRPDRLDFRPTNSTVSYGGGTLGFGAFIAMLSPLPAYNTGIGLDGREYHAWSLISYPPVPLAGQWVLHGAFEVLAGGNSTVSVSGVLADLSLVSQPYAADVLITAVPEPETWAMLLAGMGLLGGRLRAARRR